MSMAEEAPRPAIIVASRSGGVGKTTLAAVLAAMGAGRRAVCVDRTTREGASRLAQLLRPQEVEDLAISPRIEIAEPQLDLAKYWIPFDVLAGILREGDCVVDFGANVIQFFCQWAEANGVREWLNFGETRPPPILIVPVTANTRALADAREAIEAFDEVRMPVSERLVVFNEMMGSIDAVGGPDLAWLRAHEEQGSLKIARMARASGFGLMNVESGKVSFTTLPFVSPARFAHFSSVDEMRAAHSVLHFCYFATSTVDSLTRCGIVGGPTRAGWNRDALVDALERAQTHYAKFAAIRQTDLLEKVRTAIADRTGVALDEVMARMRPYDRTMLVEIFPDLFARLQEEFIDADLAHRPPDAKAVARGFEGLRLSGERRKRRVDADVRGGLRRSDLQAAVKIVTSGVSLKDPRVQRLRRMEEIRASYGDFLAIPIVLALWIFRKL
jgi:hypothetical protein